MQNRSKHDFEKAAEIVRDAGGEIIGRTKLQKIGCLLEMAGLGEGFQFSYKHYGPFSEGLATASRDADILGLITETEHQAQWGGWYSVYTANIAKDGGVPAERKELAEKAAAANSIVLELAITAAFLASQGVDDAWKETEHRKPEKAIGERVASAKKLYADLKEIDTPVRLPDI